MSWRQKNLCREQMRHYFQTAEPNFIWVYRFSSRSRLYRYSRRRPSTPATHESIIQMLDPAMAAALARKIGIPPGLLSCFELEMARLQVCRNLLLTIWRLGWTTVINGEFLTLDVSLLNYHGSLYVRASLGVTAPGSSKYLVREKFHCLEL